MKWLRTQVLFLLASVFSGCALAPFSSPKSARSLKQGQNEIDAGLLSLPYFQYTHGFSENLDLGGAIGLQFGYDVGLFAKYSIVNKPKGSSFGLVSGLGKGLSIIASDFFHFGPIWSHRWDVFEIVVHPRFNHVRWNPTEIESESDTEDEETSEEDKVVAELEGGQINYGQVHIGTNFWISHDFAVALSGIGLVGTDGAFSESLIPELSLIWLF